MAAAPQVALGPEQRHRVSGGWLSSRQQRLDAALQLAALDVGLRRLAFVMTLEQVLESAAQLGCKAAGGDIALECAEHHLVWRIAGIRKAIACGRFNKRNGVIVGEGQLGAQKIRHDAAQSSAFRPARARRREGLVAGDHQAHLVGRREIEDAASRLRLGQSGGLLEDLRRAGVEIGAQERIELGGKIEGIDGCGNVGWPRRCRGGCLLADQRLHLLEKGRQPRIVRRSLQLSHALRKFGRKPRDIFRHAQPPASGTSRRNRASLTGVSSKGVSMSST